MILTKNQVYIDRIKELMWQQTLHHPLGMPQYYGVLRYSYSYDITKPLTKYQLRQRWDREQVKKTHEFVNKLIRKTFGSDIPIWWTIERDADSEDVEGNTKKGMFHSNLYVGSINESVIENPSPYLMPLFYKEDESGIPINCRNVDMDSLKLLLLNACIRQSKWVGNHPRALFLADVPPEEMENTFMYSHKNFNSSMDAMLQVVDWDNSSFYKP